MDKEGKYAEMFIFSYSISHLQKKDKVRFYYALKGRDGRSGIIHDLKIHQFGKTVLFVSKKNEEHVKEFLEFWKCKYKSMKVFVEK